MKPILKESKCSRMVTALDTPQIHSDDIRADMGGSNLSKARENIANGHEEDSAETQRCELPESPDQDFRMQSAFSASLRDSEPGNEHQEDMQTHASNILTREQNGFNHKHPLQDSSLRNRRTCLDYSGDSLQKSGFKIVRFQVSTA